jgi:hypothetical protein
MEIFVSILLWIGGIAAAFFIFLYSAAPLVYRYLSKDLDATYAPEDTDPLADPARGQEYQERPVVTVHDDGSYDIAFGPGRTIERGTLMVRVDGMEYRAHELIAGSEPAFAKLLMERQPSAERVDDDWGPGTKHAMTWKVPGKGVSVETWIISYDDRPVVRFGIKFHEKFDGTGTGKRQDPIFKFPLVMMKGPNRRIFTYRVQVFCPPMKHLAGKDSSTQGPIVFYDNQLNAVVFGPVDHFPIARTGEDRVASGNDGNVDTRLVYHGVEGKIASIPAGYVHESLLLFTAGINNAVLEYGQLLQLIHKVFPRDPYKDLFIATLGYWTDNGAYYYYRTEKGMNYASTLLFAKRVFDKKGIPFRYVQLDSWWYKKLPKPEWTRAPKKWFAPLVKGLAKGGADVWDVVPEHFPEGLKAFREALGLPIAAHARWFAPDTAYKQFPEAYKFETSGFGALPLEERFWDDLMRRSKEMGIDHYEQDWITTMFNNMPKLQQDIEAGEHLLNWMGKAAERNGLTMQYCMAPPGMFLQALKLPAVTNARTGGDYWARAPKEFFITDITQSNILCRAIGIWPSYDVFYSKTTSIFTRQFMYREKHPEFMALTSVLGGGMVCPGDRAKHVDKDLLMQTCDDEGVLLKPDRPLTPNDIMFKPHAKPYIMDTASTISGRTWRYIVPVPFKPKQIKDLSVSLAEMGYPGDAGILYDYHSGSKLEVDGKTRVPLTSKYMAWRYFILAPWLVGGPGEAGSHVALVGIEGKFVMMPGRVVKAVDVMGKQVRICLLYHEGGSISLLFHATTSPSIVEIDGKHATGWNHDAAGSRLTLPVSFAGDKIRSVLLDFT